MASEMKKPKMHSEIVHKKKRKSLSELLDRLASQNVTTKKRSNLSRSRNLSPLPIVEQSCQKNKASSSKPSTENVTSDKIQQTNDQTQDEVTGRARGPMAYRSEQNLANMEEDPTESDSNTLSDPIFIERPFAMERKNRMLKAKGQASSKRTKRNAEDKSTQASGKYIDLNEPPNLPTEEEHYSSKSNLVNAGSIRATNQNAVASHVNKNESTITTTTDPKDQGKEVIVLSDDDDNDDDFEKTVGLMNKEPAASFDLNKMNDESCDLKHKEEEKMVLHHKEDSVSTLPLKTLWKTMRIRRQRRTKTPLSEPKPEPEPVVTEIEVPLADDGSITPRRPRTRPVWVNLRPSKDGEGGAPLPPLPKSYLRVKDAEDIPVSTLERHIEKRLNLPDTEEVEIIFGGLLVIPTLKIGDLLDVWCQNPPKNSEEVRVKVGSSGEEYVMILTYARRA